MPNEERIIELLEQILKELQTANTARAKSEEEGRVRVEAAEANMKAIMGTLPENLRKMAGGGS